MKLEFVDDPPIILSLKALAQLLVGRGDISVQGDAKIGNCELGGGTFTVDIIHPDSYVILHKEFTLADLRDTLTGCTFCTWAKDEEGDDVLACFG